ncbi:MAG: B3/B4 domain [Candidatus Alkanophagales archaeon MCA70_species_2]|nr:B3/B4 domain [Candidatus Alkanophaga liquidiphilum]
MLVAINGAVREKFRICVGVAEIKGVTQDNESRKRIDAELRRVEVWARQQFDLKGVKDAGKIRAQRDFFWRMGVDPTKSRPAAEALLRRVLAGKSLPRILPVVDAYNIASVRLLMTFSAFDAQKVKGELRVRFAEDGEEVTLIGGRKKKLSRRAVVLTDDEKILCVYAHGDVEATRVTDATTDVLLVAYGVPGMPAEEVARDLRAAASMILEFCGGTLISSEVFY